MEQDIIIYTIHGTLTASFLHLGIMIVAFVKYKACQMIKLYKQLDKVEPDVKKKEKIIVKEEVRVPIPQVIAPVDNRLQTVLSNSN